VQYSITFWRIGPVTFGSGIAVSVPPTSDIFFKKNKINIIKDE